MHLHLDISLAQVICRNIFKRNEIEDVVLRKFFTLLEMSVVSITPSRVPWDIYESALLLNATLQVQRTPKKREIIVHELSSHLRKKAENCGLVIDNIYRNDNGISLQMRKLEYALTDGEKGLRGGAKVFFDIVEIYRSDAVQFELILKEAKSMIGPSTEERFFSWLSSQVTPVQLSELYILFSEMDQYFLRTKTLANSIFQTVDIPEIHVAQKAMERDKNFRFHNKGKLGKMNAGMAAYSRWLAIYQDQIEARPTVDALEEAPEVLVEVVARADSPTALDCASEVHIEKNPPDVTQEEALPMKAKIDESRDTLYFVDWSGDTSYAFTKAEYLSYGGKRYDTADNWSRLYVQLLHCLHEDYPDIIYGLKEKLPHDRGCADIVGADGYASLRNPKLFANGLYLECNLSPTAIVGKIQKTLDICGVKHERISIAYRKRNAVDGATMTQVANRESIAQDCVSQAKETCGKMDAFYQWMTTTQNMSVSTGRGYISALKRCAKYAQKFCLEHWDFLQEDDSNIAAATIQALFENPQFVEADRRQHNWLGAAMKKYLCFIGANTASEQCDLLVRRSAVPSVAPNIEPMQYVDLPQYETLLREKFPRGFRMESGLEKGRFRKYWEQAFGSALVATDDVLQEHIASITIRHNGFAYLPDSMVSEDTKQQLLAYIGECFVSGKKAIFYVSLYKEFETIFHGQHLNSPEMLKTYLDYINNDNFWINRDFISIDGSVVVDTVQEVRECLIAHAAPMSRETLGEEMKHIPAKKIDFALSGNGSTEFVWNQTGEYFHADIVELDESELAGITTLIRRAISEKNYMSGIELCRAVETAFPSVMERYYYLTRVGLRDALAYKLRNAFSFKGPIISALGEELTMADIFANFALSHDSFSIDQLQDLKGELNSPIYFNAIYQNAVRVSKTQFVSRSNVNFDCAAIDAAIDRFCTSEYISLHDVSHFGSFPHQAFTWNTFLLQHFVSDFSLTYKLVCSGFSVTAAVGGIVRRTSDIDSFDDLLVAALADSECALDKESALQFFADNGYLARRNYSAIDQILEKSAQYRLRKG